MTALVIPASVLSEDGTLFGVEADDLKQQQQQQQQQQKQKEETKQAVLWSASASAFAQMTTAATSTESKGGGGKVLRPYNYLMAAPTAAHSRLLPKRHTVDLDFVIGPGQSSACVKLFAERTPVLITKAVVTEWQCSSTTTTTLCSPSLCDYPVPARMRSYRTAAGSGGAPLLMLDSNVRSDKDCKLTLVDVCAEPSEDIEEPHLAWIQRLASLDVPALFKDIEDARFELEGVRTDFVRVSLRDGLDMNMLQWFVCSNWVDLARSTMDELKKHERLLMHFATPPEGSSTLARVLVYRPALMDIIAMSLKRAGRGSGHNNLLMDGKDGFMLGLDCRLDTRSTLLMRVRVEYALFEHPARIVLRAAAAAEGGAGTAAAAGAAKKYEGPAQATPYRSRLSSRYA